MDSLLLASKGGKDAKSLVGLLGLLVGKTDCYCDFFIVSICLISCVSTAAMDSTHKPNKQCHDILAR